MSNTEKLIENSGLKKVHIAEKLGISRQTLDNWILKDTPEIYDKVKSVLSISEDYAVKARGIVLKLIKSIKAGEPGLLYIPENVEDEIFVQGWTKQDHCYLLRVMGDSMTASNGKSIKENDIVLVDIDEMIIPGDIVAVSLQNGREMIKQYWSGEEDSIILRSYNSKYPDIKVTEAEIIVNHKVIGIVPKLIYL